LGILGNLLGFGDLRGHRGFNGSAASGLGLGDAFGVLLFDLGELGLCALDLGGQAPTVQHPPGANQHGSSGHRGTDSQVGQRDHVRPAAGLRSGCGRCASAMQPEATTMVSGWLNERSTATHAAASSAGLVAMCTAPPRVITRM
jgi:hypothetical protein